MTAPRRLGEAPPDAMLEAIERASVPEMRASSERGELPRNQRRLSGPFAKQEAVRVSGVPAGTDWGVGWSVNSGVHGGGWSLETLPPKKSQR